MRSRRVTSVTSWAFSVNSASDGYGVSPSRDSAVLGTPKFPWRDPAPWVDIGCGSTFGLSPGEEREARLPQGLSLEDATLPRPPARRAARARPSRPTGSGKAGRFRAGVN